MSTETTPTEQHRPTTDPDQQIVHDDVAVEIRYDHESQQSIIKADHLAVGASGVFFVDGEVTPKEAGEVIDEAAQTVAKEVRSNGGDA